MEQKINVEDVEMSNNDLSDRVFVENPDIKLQSAVSFAQYVLGKKLFTIIGESHETEFECQYGYSSITIAEYALKILRTNVNSRVLLEIDPRLINHPTFWPRSTPIKKILSEADEQIRGRITGYDHRTWWIETYYYVLYHDINRLWILSTQQMIDKYILPFFQKVQQFMSGLSDRDYNRSDYPLISKIFPTDIEQHLNTLRAAIQGGWEMKPGMPVHVGGRYKGTGILLDVNGDIASVKLDVNSLNVSVNLNIIKLKINGEIKTLQKNKQEIIDGLQHVWKKVTDWQVLIEFFRKNSGNEIIAIMGEEHSKNLMEVFSNIEPVTKQQGKKIRDCVSLFEVKSITDIINV
tara:strand:- start:12269 stop:13315 length:1047 start_codon:yes stop_codon:yes gene_type:complete